ncbi:MAG: hypothetical protein LKI76_08490 [Megasphaera sp.]|jgi:quercetin dioxygenase-like cupin family protein|uniref:cupin domain-containing protein n=1 Tax=Megasphaera sueciensis TaxID=349094 RepID=UPI003D03CC65|nr:hypothetical protein [Megasphaera sp.]MCI1823952.1 hypothetical protein [Megasphaera sp.]
MNKFPEFMTRPMNKVPMQQQNTPDIQGCYYTAADGSQMTFWTCMADRISKEHQHDYNGYMVCLSGEYVITISGEETVLHSGDELFIPQESVQGGKCKAETRIIRAFGSRRII